MTPLRIIWFEDQIGNFKSIIPMLEAHCISINRQLEKVVYDYYPADFDVKMFEGNYSLAFVDLNLKNGQKGIEIIDILRSKGVFMDILLYSNNPTELISLTEGDNYIEGVHRHATYREIEDKMKSMIDQINYKEIMVLKRHGFA